MSRYAIQATVLTKEYRLGNRVQGYKTLQESVLSSVKSLAKVAGSLFAFNERKPSNEVFRALWDVSFDVKHGEVVGIIGRNGAGKSTLLKILSRVTEPTSGMAEIHGRLGSLLEVGTGFHPELTGRENIFLNGAILGMRQEEIKRKFDEIVAFAEVEQFLDTQVKRYSSGMHLRLGFSVAAHLEPEILVIDEILAVGDAGFQRKCLGKMNDIAKQGRTVLFVSHNMPAVVNLCTRAIVLNRGQVITDSTVDAGVEMYFRLLKEATSTSLTNRTDRKGDGRLRILSVEHRNFRGEAVPAGASGAPLTLALQYESRDGCSLRGVHVAIGIHGQFDENLFHLATDTAEADFAHLPARGEIICTIPELPLQPGSYSFNLFCEVGGETADWIQGAGTIEVEAGDFFGSGRLPPHNQGPFLVRNSWQVIS